MKVFAVILVIALWGFLIYKVVKEAKARRLNRYSKVFEKIAERMESGEGYEDNEEENV